MLEKVSELTMHKVRWLMTIGWLLLIFSLFWDPLSPWLTSASNTWSPLHIDPSSCNLIQGKCYFDVAYPLGARLFWAAIVPSSIFILLTFGHVFWRRICPLSFLSQLPAALGIQRRVQRRAPTTGRLRSEVAKVRKNSWLANNYLYLQFGLLYLGLCIRILFINADRTALGLFLIVTIASAIAVGYWFGGKSWCQYFCPMAPVQVIFAEPRGVLTEWNQHSPQSLSQSICRTVDWSGREKSNCIGCQSPCLDIDVESHYWEMITRHDRKFIHYAYIGLIAGFYFYYFLYAGNWNYYFSAHWTHEDQLGTLWNPGFYLFDQAIPIPKLIAVPLTLGSFSMATYWLGLKIEKIYKDYKQRFQDNGTPQYLQHQLFTVCTFIAFNLFFVFGGRPSILLLPKPLQYLFDALILFVSCLWISINWKKMPKQNSQKQLLKKSQAILSHTVENHAVETERLISDLNDTPTPTC